MFKRTLITLSLVLAACQPAANNETPSASEASSASAVAASAPISANDINFRDHIRQNMMKRIQQEAASGKIPPEQLETLLKNKEAINQWVETVNQILNQSISNKAEQMASEQIGELESILKEGSKESKPVNRETLPPLGKEIYDRIKGNMPNSVLNHIMPLGSAQPYFLTHLNNTSMPMITQRDAEYYVSPTDLQKDGTARLWDKKGKEITDAAGQAQVYRKMLQTINEDKALANKVPFKQWGKYDEKRVIYMFVDPDCDYCRTQHEDFANKLKDSDNITIRYVFNPLPVHPEAADKVGKILCTDDVSASWNRYVERSVKNGGFPTVNGNGNYDRKACQFAVNEHRKYSSIFNLGTTPTMISASGKRYVGVHEWEKIKKSEKW